MSDSAERSLVVLIAAHTCAWAADTADRGIALEVPNNMLSAGPVIGAWATVSLRRDGMLVQVERDGHPSMNPIVIADDQKDEFNAGQPADDVENYLKPLSELLEGHGYPHDEATAAALTLLPDILSYDRTRPAAYPNGRAVTDDVFSARAAYVSHGQATSQGLAPHDDMLAEFPLLGLPNPTVGPAGGSLLS